MKRFLIALVALSFGLSIAGCTSAPKKSPSDFVKISLKDDVVVEGNTVCRLTPNTSGACLIKVVHPEPSLLMFTIADGKYQLTPAGVRVPYYHSDQRNDQVFVVRNQDGSPVGECTVKLEQLAHERVYRERCMYSATTVDAVTKRDVQTNKLMSMVGTIRQGNGLRNFIVE